MVKALENVGDWRVDWMLEKNDSHNLCIRIDQNSGKPLDIGFGTGAMTINARKSGMNIVGIDQSGLYVEDARRLAIEAGLSIDEAGSVIQ
ncbi:MAG TPA: class I SAM-dependent methyltransferase [Bacteroidota bacterium]|nr:class I SAM-dependent methyltransferase [Bacteroidota bacterium]